MNWGSYKQMVTGSSDHKKFDDALLLTIASNLSNERGCPVILRTVTRRTNLYMDCTYQAEP